MKAMVWTNYGPPDVLQLQEVEKPAPKDNEVLIKIVATTVSAGDCEARNLKFPFWLGLPMRFYIGLRKPSRITILGQELTGEIEALGKDVTLFKVGDKVCATTGFKMGAYAEYKCLPQEFDDGALGIKPANMSYEQAAAISFGGLDALHFIRKANIQSGQKILINGAGGSIGTYAVQLAKHFGAEVTAVDSAAKLQMLRSIGADRVIDYTVQDFTRNGQIYDVIFDVVGKASLSGSVKSLQQGGTYLSANPKLSQMFHGAWISLTSSKKMIFTAADKTRADFNFLKELIEAGKIRTVIDRTYPLEQMAEAHSYVETGKKAGSVIIIVDPAYVS